MNHIPLYTDIVFVELDLNHILSAATRRKFKNDLDKRRKRRQSKIQAEKRADRVILKQDQDRINERKARSQTVDPDDAFFQAAATISGPAAPSEQPDPIILDAADFGPMPGADTGTGATTTSTTSNLESEANRINNDAGTGRNSSPPSSSFSFSQAAQRGSSAANNFSAAAEAFPALSSSAAFPTLGGSSSASASASASAPASHASGSSSSWRSESSTVAAKLAAKNAPSVDPATTVHGTPGGSKKKKKKVKNLVLFSTGGARGY